MLWNEDVPREPAISVWTWHPADTWDKTPAGTNTSLSKATVAHPSETVGVSVDRNVTKPMRHVSTRCIIYIFGNQYYLLSQVSNNLSLDGGISATFHASTRQQQQQHRWGGWGGRPLRTATRDAKKRTQIFSQSLQ